MSTWPLRPMVLREGGREGGRESSLPHDDGGGEKEG